MLKTLFSLIKIEHTLFALPLALTGAVLGARGLPPILVLLLMAVAFTAARASAMAFNRIADRHLDVKNPRTASREIPSGTLSVSQVWLLVITSIAVFLAASWAINPLCGKLAPFALVVLLGYSYTKRFTHLCHYLLGLALGMAPVAGWIAVTGTIAFAPVVLGLGVIFWTAGFDILYACQDVEFDRDMGLHSIPAKLGTKKALKVAALSHVAAFLLFILSGAPASLGVGFYLFLIITGGLLIWEHRLITPDDLAHLDMAFFKVNSLVSGSLFLAVIAGLV
ncbi:MAG: 4-hydroxybenzoate octaprenyltransferase [Desulfobacteraceae bacterium 4572_87]|nr:MAG: 4-hydroxybenzoate octaprenyltransferase [Desulfobacteraceae bacterium 4572_87]